MLKNYCLVLCYDGTRYRGWQKQGNTNDTIQGKLETLLSRLLEQPVSVHGAGRTDAGVHALAQAASFRADTELTCQELIEKIRSYLPEDIGAVSLREADERFHARLSAKRKVYTYRIWNSTDPCVFERKYRYVHPGTLDLNKMRRAAGTLIGKHDFAAFSTGKSKGKPTVRTLYSLEIEKHGNEILLKYTGDGFLYNMVRILTGTLIEIGEGNRDPESVIRLLNGGKREDAGYTAPACGLFLTEVCF